MTSTQAPVPGAWPAVADAGHLLVSALYQSAPGQGIPGGGLPPQHKPVELTLLARTLDGLKALSTERGPGPAADQPRGTPQAEVREAGLAVWPLFAGLGPLGALPTAPRLVRSFAALVLGTWGLAAFGDDTELLLSELATNAVAAATGPDGRPRYDDSGGLHLLWARLLSDRQRLRLEVWDTIREEMGVPVQRQAGPDDESGRGLELLEMLSAAWGWEPVPGRAAKKVWAELHIG
jgi:hypothetical protein